MKAAAVTSIFLGLGFGLPDVYAIWHLGRTGSVARFLGYPTYGGARPAIASSSARARMRGRFSASRLV